MNMPTCMGKNPQGLSLTQRTTANWVKLGTGEVALPKKDHTNWLSSAKEFGTLKQLDNESQCTENSVYLAIM